MDAATYNYAHFTPALMTAPDFTRFREKTMVGKPAPDATLVSLADRSEVKLSSLWKEIALVIEFGSLT